MITRLLVANRGEIARRVFATCRRLGIATVAVYTDPDAESPHVAEADTRVHLHGVQGYLDIDALVAAARAADADAVHPGYGFLSENAEFADAVQTAGLIWVGPPAAAVTAMGSKIESKNMMAAAGVPVLDELDPAAITEDDLPVLVKAASGGGGRGIRVVTALADLVDAVEAARREAHSAFGDATVFCERYLSTGHHVEVQVMADAHGTVWAVGERECSIQRRHQKIIEEAPSPLVERTPGMRERLFDAARRAAGVVGYTGAGTVEFLADGGGDFYFLEMNTRLQVEHPVTEATTGLDLVELQLLVASDVALSTQPPAAHGFSIEARLYAEDPAAGWQPQAGTVHHFEVPPAETAFCGPPRRGVRVDSGIVHGSKVSIHYDPMLAKVISLAPTRGQAAALLVDALARTRLHGLRTNRDLLVNVLRHPAFRAGHTDTAFFDTHDLVELSRSLTDAATLRRCAVAAALADAAHNRTRATKQSQTPSGWRNLPSSHQVKTFRDPDATEHHVRYRFTRDGLLLPDDDGVRLVCASARQVILADPAGLETVFDIARHGAAVFIDSSCGSAEFTTVPRLAEPGSSMVRGSLVAPMPGVVIRLAGEAGDTVAAGQPLVWLEAMKMEHTLTAPTDGVIAEVRVATGQQVEVGSVLVIVRATEKPEAEGSEQ